MTQPSLLYSIVCLCYELYIKFNKLIEDVPFSRLSSVDYIDFRTLTQLIINTQFHFEVE